MKLFVITKTKSDFLYTKVSESPPNTFYGLGAYGTQQEVPCLKISDKALIIFMAINIFTNYNYFRKACYVEINTLRYFLQRQLCLCKKTMAGEGTRGHQFQIYLLIYSNKLACLQLIIVLVYRSNLPKSHEQGYLNLRKNLEKHV